MEEVKESWHGLCDSYLDLGLYLFHDSDFYDHKNSYSTIDMRYDLSQLTTLLLHELARLKPLCGHSFVKLAKRRFAAAV